MSLVVRVVDPSGLVWVWKIEGRTEEGRTLLKRRTTAKEMGSREYWRMMWWEGKEKVKRILAGKD